MATDIVKFATAGLPKINVGTFRNQLQEARDAVSVSGGTPFLKLTKNDGAWVYGQEDTEVEEGSLWAINPLSMQTGLIAWPPNNSKLKEPIKKMRAIFDTSAPIIDKNKLGDPANGGDWDECISFQLQCIGGVGPKKEKIEDVGVVIEYQQNSFGGKQAFDEVAKAMMVQGDASPLLIVPVVSLKTDSYEHPKWGTVYKPIFEIVKWVGMDGSTEAKAAEPEGETDTDTGDKNAAAETPTPRRGRGASAAEPAAAAAADTSPVQRRRRRA
jgi:hypothetical protein